MARLFKAEEKAKLDSEQRADWNNPQQILQQVGVKNGLVLADLGCGTGYFTIPASKIVGSNGVVYAVDLQEELLDGLRDKLAKHNSSNIRVIQANIKSTRIDNGVVDIALIINVFHEVDEKEVLLSEVKRILKKNGHLGLVDWKKQETEKGPPLEERIDLNEVLGILSDSGLRIVKTFDAGPYTYGVLASKR